MINGILNINKPEGITSAKVVAKIKNNLGLNKAGHTGTLDPFATGVLLICINHSTKISQYLSDSDKEYTGTMILGITTDTQDIRGKVLKIKKVDTEKLNMMKIKKIFNSFKGILYQRPPMFSAVKYKGARLYSLARKGIIADVDPRKIIIDKLEITKIQYDYYPSITFNVRCSKGTYIRTLCHEIGKALGYGAFCSNLKRTRIGNITIKQSIGLEYFLNMPIHKKNQIILPPGDALNHLDKIILHKNDKTLLRIKNGGLFSEEEILKNKNLKD